MKSSLYTKVMLLVVALVLGACRGESIQVTHNIPAGKHADYEALLPDIPGIGPSATPQIAVIGSMAAGDFYLEGTVQIRLNYEGDDYWWPIYMPLNNQLGLDTGLPLGYPKVLKTMCHTDDGAYYTFSFGACDNYELRIQHYTLNKQVAKIKDTPVISDGTHGFMSLSQDGCLLNSGQPYTNPESTMTRREGVVYLENFLPQQWAHLMPSGFYGATLYSSTLEPQEGPTTPVGPDQIENPIYPIYKLKCGL